MNNNLLLALIFITGFSFNVNAKEPCNPVVNIDKKQKMLSDALVFLAQENGFILSFPKKLDRKISVNENMPLDKMVQFLTRDLNTLLKHDDATSCVGKKMTELIIMPSGDDTSFITVTGHSQSKSKRYNPDKYMYIEDMDAYVRGVMEEGKKTNRRMMTPEQKATFNEAKRKWKKNSRQGGYSDDN